MKWWNSAATDGILGALHDVHVKNSIVILSPRHVQVMSSKGAFWDAPTVQRFSVCCCHRMKWWNSAATDGILGALHDVHVKNSIVILSPRHVQVMSSKGAFWDAPTVQRFSVCCCHRMKWWNSAATDGILGALHDVHVKNSIVILSPRHVQVMSSKGAFWDAPTVQRFSICCCPVE